MSILPVGFDPYIHSPVLPSVQNEGANIDSEGLSPLNPILDIVEINNIQLNKLTEQLFESFNNQISEQQDKLTDLLNRAESESLDAFVSEIDNQMGTDGIIYEAEANDAFENELSELQGPTEKEAVEPDKEKIDGNDTSKPAEVSLLNFHYGNCLEKILIHLVLYGLTGLGRCRFFVQNKKLDPYQNLHQVVCKLYSENGVYEINLTTDFLKHWVQIQSNFQSELDYISYKRSITGKIFGLKGTFRKKILFTNIKFLGENLGYLTKNKLGNWSNTLKSSAKQSKWHHKRLSDAPEQSSQIQIKETSDHHFFVKREIQLGKNKLSAVFFYRNGLILPDIGSGVIELNEVYIPQAMPMHMPHPNFIVK